MFVCEKCHGILISKPMLLVFLFCFEHTKLFSWFDIGQINFLFYFFKGMGWPTEEGQ